MSAKLTEQQRNTLFDALVSAFPSLDDLEVLTGRYLGTPLQDISRSAVRPTVIMRVLIVVPARFFADYVVPTPSASATRLM